MKVGKLRLRERLLLVEHVFHHRTDEGTASHGLFQLY